MTIGNRTNYRGPQDFCEICEKYVPRMELVRTNVRFLQPQGMNLFAYSSYNSSGWTADNDPVGQYSIGVNATRALARVNDDDDWPTTQYNTVTEYGGSWTWEDSPVSIVSSAVDVSSYSSITFRCSAGLYHGNVTNALTLVMGYTADGQDKQQQGSWTIKSSEEPWFTLNISELESPYSASALQLYITATCDGMWWVDNFQLDSGTSPGNFIRTSGAAKTYATEGTLLTVRKVCPKCRERLLTTSRTYEGVGSEEMPQSIPSDMQEV